MMPVQRPICWIIGGRWTYRHTTFNTTTFSRVSRPPQGDWTGRLYVNNVANSRGILNGGPATLIPYAYYYIMPREIGLQLTKKF